MNLPRFSLNPKHNGNIKIKTLLGFRSSAIEYNTLDLDVLKSFPFDVDEDRILWKSRTLEVFRQMTLP